MTRKQQQYLNMINILIDKGNGKKTYDDLLGTEYYVNNLEYLDYNNNDGSRERGVSMVIDENGKVRSYNLYCLSADRDTENPIKDKWEVLSTKEWKRFERELNTIYKQVREVQNFKRLGI